MLASKQHPRSRQSCLLIFWYPQSTRAVGGRLLVQEAGRFGGVGVAVQRKMADVTMVNNMVLMMRRGRRRCRLFCCCVYNKSARLERGVCVWVRNEPIKQVCMCVFRTPKRTDPGNRAPPEALTMIPTGRARERQGRWRERSPLTRAAAATRARLSPYLYRQPHYTLLNRPRSTLPPTVARTLPLAPWLASRQKTAPCGATGRSEAQHLRAKG